MKVWMKSCDLMQINFAFVLLKIELAKCFDFCLLAFGSKQSFNILLMKSAYLKLKLCIHGIIKFCSLFCSLFIYFMSFCDF